MHVRNVKKAQWEPHFQEPKSSNLMFVDSFLVFTHYFTITHLSYVVAGPALDKLPIVTDFHARRSEKLAAE